MAKWAESAGCLRAGSQAGRTQILKSCQETIQTAGRTHGAKDAKSKAELSAEKPSPHP